MLRAGESPAATQPITFPTWEPSTGRVVAGDSPAHCFMLVSAMLRRYNYPGRYLPHIQKDNRSLFITFTTHLRWQLPDAARDLALEACVHAHNRRCILHVAVIMPDHVHLILTPSADKDGAFCIPKSCMPSRVSLLTASIRR